MKYRITPPAFTLEVEGVTPDEAADMFYEMMDEIFERGTRDTLQIEIL